MTYLIERQAPEGEWGVVYRIDSAHTTALVLARLAWGSLYSRVAAVGKASRVIVEALRTGVAELPAQVAGRPDYRVLVVRELGGDNESQDREGNTVPALRSHL